MLRGRKGSLGGLVGDKYILQSLGKYRNGRIVVSLSLGGLVGPQGSPQWQKVVTCCRGKEVSGGDGEFLILTESS